MDLIINNSKVLSSMQFAFLLLVLIFSIKLMSQDLVIWAPSSNNLIEGMSIIHINLGVPATIDFLNDGSDVIANIMVKVYNQSNIL